MKPMYPQILSWLAGKARIPGDDANALWDDALRKATAEGTVIESPEYWKSAVCHLRASLTGCVHAASVGQVSTAAPTLPARPELQMALPPPIDSTVVGWPENRAQQSLAMAISACPCRLACTQQLPSSVRSVLSRTIAARLTSLADERVLVNAELAVTDG